MDNVQATELNGPLGGTSDPLEKGRRPLAARAEFYLVYLFFYFVPWGIRSPEIADIVAALVAIGIFLPIHFRVFQKSTPNYIPLIALTSAIGFAVTPFNGAPGVFHIYAATQAGFQRPGRSALLLITILTIVYIAGTFLLGRTWVEIGFVTFLGIVSALGCIAGAEQMAQARRAENIRILEREQARLHERERIARDLHDLLGHTLTMVALKSDIANRVMENDPARARAEVREIRDAARTALKDVRALVADMTVTTIEDEVKRAKRALSSASVSLSVIGNLPHLRTGAQTLAGLAIREAITNIIRHAGASAVVIEFHRHDDRLDISIKDDGRGGEFAKDTRSKNGSGLNGLIQRIDSLGGQVVIDGTDGTIITLMIPVDNVVDEVIGS